MKSVLVLLLTASLLFAADEKPFRGITHITRKESSPRTLEMHIVKIDLNASGIRFKLTPPGGSRETVRQTTVGFINEEHAQVAINAHFFLPFPSDDRDANLIGLAASDGNVYSGCEIPIQSYALVPNAPALNIDSRNRGSIVHCDSRFEDGKHVVERVELWNTFAGSAQIVTNGAVTIPQYSNQDHPSGILTANAEYSNSHSWYDVPRARTAVGLTRNNRTLVLFTVDESGGGATRTGGMTLREVAGLLIRDYSVYNALNMDGGGSTSLAIEDPATHSRRLVNHPSDIAAGRAVASNLAIFAVPKNAR
jgi:exopolysaccharide biosynthesis protein